MEIRGNNLKSANKVILEWNRRIRSQNQQIIENNQIIRESIIETREYLKKSLKFKSKLIYKP